MRARAPTDLDDERGRVSSFVFLVALLTRLRPSLSGDHANDFRGIVSEAFEVGEIGLGPATHV